MVGYFSTANSYSRKVTNFLNLFHTRPNNGTFFPSTKRAPQLVTFIQPLVTVVKLLTFLTCFIPGTIMKLNFPLPKSSKVGYFYTAISYSHKVTNFLNLFHTRPNNGTFFPSTKELLSWLLFYSH